MSNNKSTSEVQKTLKSLDWCFWLCEKYRSAYCFCLIWNIAFCLIVVVSGCERERGIERQYRRRLIPIIRLLNTEGDNACLWPPRQREPFFFWSGEFLTFFPLINSSISGSYEGDRVCFKEIRKSQRSVVGLLNTEGDNSCPWPPRQQDPIFAVLFFGPKNCWHFSSHQIMHYLFHHPPTLIDIFAK